MATTAQYLTELVEQKNALVDALNEKGVEASKEEKFNTLIPKVADIPTGDNEWIKLIDGTKKATFTASPELFKDVTKITPYAFDGCKAITWDKLWDGLTEVGNNGFNNTGITIKELPDSLVTIGLGGFGNNLGITEIKSNAAINMLSTNIFGYCYNLTTVYFPNVSKIPSQTFYSCKALKTATFGTVTSTHNQSFINCSALENVVIGEGTTASLYFTSSPLLTQESIHKMIENIADMTGKTAPKFTVHANCTAIDEEHLNMINSKNREHNFVLEEVA